MVGFLGLAMCAVVLRMGVRRPVVAVIQLLKGKKTGNGDVPKYLHTAGSSDRLKRPKLQRLKTRTERKK